MFASITFLMARTALMLALKAFLVALFLLAVLYMLPARARKVFVIAIACITGTVIFLTGLGLALYTSYPTPKPAEQIAAKMAPRITAKIIGQHKGLPLVRVLEINKGGKMVDFRNGDPVFAVVRNYPGNTITGSVITFYADRENEPYSQRFPAVVLNCNP